MSAPAWQTELQSLLEKHLEQDLSSDERARVNEILQSESAARKFYLTYAYAHHALEFRGVDPELQQSTLAAVLDVKSEQPVGHAPRDMNDEPLYSARGACPTPRKSLLNWASRHPKVPAIAIAIAVLLMVVGVMAITPMGKWLAGSGKNTEEQQPESPATSDFVAILNNSHQAKWLDGTQPRLKDPRLKVGRRLAIASGLIEVKYYTGAKVVIEGPAEFYVGPKDEGGGRKKEGGESEGHPSSFILHPSNSGYLALGKLVARVEGKKAQGFTIDTPSGRVEDHGTEFGVEVDDAGAAKFVVLTGKVDFVYGATEDRPGERIRLSANQGVFVAARGGAVTRMAKVDPRLLAEYRRRIRNGMINRKRLVIAQLKANMSQGMFGTGQTFTPSVGIVPNPGNAATVDLTAFSLFRGKSGSDAPSPTAFLNIYDGDPNAGGRLVGSSTNSDAIGPGDAVGTEYAWTFDRLSLDYTTKYWAVISSEASGALDVGVSLQVDSTNPYAGGHSLMAHQKENTAGRGTDAKFEATFEATSLDNMEVPTDEIQKKKQH